MVQSHTYLGRKVALPLMVFVMSAVPGLVLLIVHQDSSGMRSGVVFADQSCDVGEVCVGGREVDGVFTFVNKMRKPVRIDRIVSSCSCAVPEYTKEPIPQGQMGRVVVRVDADERDEVGPFDKGLAVVFADAKHPPVKLMVKGTIVQPLRIIPTAISLGRATRDDFPMVRSVKIVNSRDHVVRLQRFGSANGLVEVGRAARDIPPHGEVMVQIRVAGPASIGCFREALEIETDEPLTRKIRIPVYGWLAGEFIVEPETLKMGFVGQETPGKRSIHLTRADGKPFRILRDRWEGVCVQARFDEAPRCEHVIDVQCSGQGMEPGEARGRLILDVVADDHPAAQCVIDVTAYVG